MAILNTLKGDNIMSWFKHKPPKYPPHREPNREPIREQVPQNNKPTK